MYQQEGYIGWQIGEYRLVSKLGGGGFGTVYLAEHVHDHTRAAVKVLNISLTKHEDLRNFLNEASTIRLRHPHIVPLLNFGISRDDLPFLVMEYAPQGTLRDRHPKGERIPLPAIVSYVNQIASALQYAHEHYVIHQDVKPENILARADRTLMISDFGIAKILEQSVLMSQQKVAGTPVYMAPEQHRGYPCFASDQYALAVIVYEWICGVRPFQGTAIGLAAQHMNTPPPSLRNYLPELPEAVERVVFKALAKAPEDRFESIQIFADALHSAMQPILISSPIEDKDTASPVSSTPNDQDLSQDRSNQLSQDDTPLLAASNAISIHVEPKKPMIRVNRAPITKRLLSLMAMVLGGSVALSIIMPYLVDAIKFTPRPPVIQPSILPTSTSKAIQTSLAQVTISTPTVVQVSLTQFPTSTPIVAQVSPTQVPTPTPIVAPASPTQTPTPSPHATDSAAPNYRPSGSYTKWWATTFGTAPGYMGSRQVGVLYANKNYMFCKAWGGMVTDSSGNYNHWWLWTDLDNHGGQGWVSAYYLKNWGNDEAKDDSGHVIPNC